ncbi:flagellar filament capping protein FliD [Solimonas marina]|uniref:Flagellar hook-associated protein 2 n=1 Tax=Solimonas marina TaxID=2714601 RepID=A0A970B3Y6_9GAMM|nr:flagellar filament capping protein FliD [Solimonas marina]NKF21772.1 flagellar filament capping protein FliD [Solimonas marina]
MATVSTSTFTNAGVGSGLDLETLITNLVSAERSPTETRLTTKQSTLTTQLSAVGTFKATLANVQSKLAALQSGGTLATLTATSSDESIFTATASSSATRGSYDVEVVNLARANKQASSAFASSSTSLGAGDVQISVGSSAFTVTLDSSANTLTDLKNAINDSSNNTGVTATIINESGGARLLLTSNDTGTDHQISVNSSLISFTETQAAQDAHIRVDGYDVYSGSNTVDDAIDGVSINLQKAQAGTTETLNLALDNSSAKSAIQTFVTAYNAAMTTMAALTKYDPDSNTAAALNGDAMVRGAQSTLRNLVGGSFSGAGTYQYLSQLGITTETDGTLTIDDDKLSTALDADSGSVQKLFGGDDGLAAQLDTAIGRLVDDGGLVEARQDALQSRLDDISDQFDQLDTRMTSVEARYRAQFTALDTLISSMQTTSDFLTTQLKQIEAIGTYASSSSSS